MKHLKIQFKERKTKVTHDLTVKSFLGTKCGAAGDPKPYIELENDGFVWLTPGDAKKLIASLSEHLGEIERYKLNKKIIAEEEFNERRREREAKAKGG